MALDLDSLLPTTERAAILQARIDGFAREAFDWTIAAQVADQEGDAAAATEAAAAIATLTTAIDVHQTELAALLPDDESD